MSKLPSTKKVSSSDVARLAGVSSATVSYVLNRRADQTIREETRLKVIRAVQTLGYQPNLAARTLATGKTGTVALWVPNSYHSVFSHVIEQVMQRAQEHGFHVVIVHINTETRQSLAQSGLLSGWNVDAILALDARDLIEDILDSHPQAPHIISIGPAYSTRVDHVGVDLQGGSLQAVRHLVETGRHNVAFAGVRSRMRAGDPRYDAYMQVMNESWSNPEFIELERGDYEGSYQTFCDYFAAGSWPDGLFCWNDETAISAIRALSDLGIKVPEDVAVIGSDGIRETRYAVPAISTVAQPFGEMCELAWNFLQRRLQNPRSAIQRAILPMTLLERASTLAD